MFEGQSDDCTLGVKGYIAIVVFGFGFEAVVVDAWAGVYIDQFVVGVGDEFGIENFIAVGVEVDGFGGE